MNSVEKPHRTAWRQDARPLIAEVVHMLELRRSLMTLEINQDRQLIRRCLIVGSCGVILALVGLPLLLQIAAQGLADLTTLSVTAWTLILGSVLLVPGLLLLARTISKFRSEFRGLRDTLAELHEDMIWLGEWLPGDPRDDGEATAQDEETA